MCNRKPKRELLNSAEPIHSSRSFGSTAALRQDFRHGAGAVLEGVGRNVHLLEHGYKEIGERNVFAEFSVVAVLDAKVGAAGQDAVGGGQGQPHEGRRVTHSIALANDHAGDVFRDGGEPMRASDMHAGNVLGRSARPT